MAVEVWGKRRGGGPDFIKESTINFRSAPQSCNRGFNEGSGVHVIALRKKKNAMENGDSPIPTQDGRELGYAEERIKGTYPGENRRKGKNPADDQKKSVGQGEREMARGIRDLQKTNGTAR